MTINLPEFPVDETTLDLVLSAVRPDAESGQSSLGDLCQMYAEMAVSDPASVEDSGEDNGDYVNVMRDPLYHAHDVIAALVLEIKRLRGQGSR